MKYSWEQMAWAKLRIVLGLMFLWSFVDKMWGLGFPTTPRQALANGGEPIAAWLNNMTSGPFASWFQMLADRTWIEWVVMLVMLVVGVGLTFGIMTRLASWLGIIFLALAYLASFPPENNPLLSEQIVYMIILFAFTRVQVGNVWGCGAKWAKMDIVKKLPILR